jgi:hypothetical protein
MVKDFLRLGKGVNHNATGMSRPKQPQSRRIDCGMNGERLVCSTNQYIVTLARMAALQSRQIILAQERIYADSSHSLLIWWSAATSHRGVL